MTVVTLGLDLGKNWVHMVGLDQEGRIVLRRRVRRDRLLAQTGNMAPCLIGMEACCGAHHLGRALETQGHTSPTDAPGTSVSRTIANFSSESKRRRSARVTTSIVDIRLFI